MTMRRFSHPRGALLLVILALLTMFGLVAVALVVVTQHARRNAIIMGRAETANEPAPQLLDDAMRQVIRGDDISPWLGALTAGTAGAGSGIGPHSLLETMYGNLAIVGTVNASLLDNPAPTQCGMQMWTLSTTSMSALSLPNLTLTPSSTPLGGRVITMTSGAAAGQSSLIVNAYPLYATGGTAVTCINYNVMAFDSGIVPAGTDTFTINGVPFSGAGFGYSSTAATTFGSFVLSDTTAVNLATATISSTDLTPVVPHPPRDSQRARRAFAPSPSCPAIRWRIICARSGTVSSNNPPGGANTDYTAADFQHMLLAAQTPQTPGVVGPMLTPIPSLHRPELVAYWANVSNQQRHGLAEASSGPDADDLSAAQRQGPSEFLRGSNPNFDPTWDGDHAAVAPGQHQQPAWDVDNDGDGVPDSVWVDLGMPVRAAADGRHYKPLFAILCVDLDGRLNVNAHGVYGVPGPPVQTQPHGETSDWRQH